MAQEIKRSVHKLVDQISDPAILNTCHSILYILLDMQDKMAVAYSADGVPLSESNYIREVVEASQRVKAGKFIGQQDLENELSDW